MNKYKIYKVIDKDYTFLDDASKGYYFDTIEDVELALERLERGRYTILSIYDI